MGRVGRYTLAVMVWVAAFAGWSTVLGLVIASVTGKRLGEGDTVPVGVSAGFTILVSLVPTLAALWFNDWARDGFPTREDRRRRTPPVARPVAADSRALEAALAGMPDQVPDAELVEVEPARVVGTPPSPYDVPGPAGGPHDDGAGFYPVAPMRREDQPW